MPLIVDGVVGTLLGTWKRMLLTACAVVIPVTGAIVGTSAAWPIVEPWGLYSRGGTRDLVQTAQQSSSNELTAYAAASKARDERAARLLHRMQIDAANGKAETVDSNLFKAELELKKATDDATRQFIAEQINKLIATKRKIENQLDSLNKADGQ